MDSEKEKKVPIDNGFGLKSSTQNSSLKKPSVVVKDPYIEFLEFAKHREDYMASGKGILELKALAKEIDDERTAKDIHKVKVLDVGCLNGVAMKILRQQYGIKNIEGVDIDYYSSEECKKHGEVCTALDIMDLKKSYDIIYMQHLSEDHKFLAKVITKCLQYAKKKVIVVLNIFNEKEATDLVRDVPDENHRYIKDVVKYQLGQTIYRVWMIVFYSKDNIQNKGE